MTQREITHRLVISRNIVQTILAATGRPQKLDKIHERLRVLVGNPKWTTRQGISKYNENSVDLICKVLKKNLNVCIAAETIINQKTNWNRRLVKKTSNMRWWWMQNIYILYRTSGWKKPCRIHYRKGKIWVVNM